MTEQMILPGMPEKREPTDSLFLALVPEAYVAHDVARIAQQARAEYQLKAPPLKTSSFHVTLHYLGRFDGVPEKIVEAVKKVARTTADLVAPFEVTFDRMVSFSGKNKHPLVLLEKGGNAELMHLHRLLATALGAPEARFTPHLTLLYDERSIAERPIAPVSWTVREFVLVHSQVGKTIHEHLVRWPLRG